MCVLSRTNFPLSKMIWCFSCLTFSVISNITLTHIFNLGKLACTQAINNTKSFKTTEHLEYWTNILLLWVKCKTNMSECKYGFIVSSNIAPVKNSFWNHWKKIRAKKSISFKIVYYEKSSISSFERFFTSFDKIFS